MGDELKSTLDIVMDKLKGMDKDIRGLDEGQRRESQKSSENMEQKLLRKKSLSRTRRHSLQKS